jgi:hypothetical protein
LYYIIARQQQKAVNLLSNNSDSSERESTEDGYYDIDLTEPEDEGLQDKDISDAVQQRRLNAIYRDALLACLIVQ